MGHKCDNGACCNLCTCHSHPMINIGTGRLKKYEDECRPSKLLHYCDQPEYWEESSRFAKTCCQSNSSDKQSASAGVKNSQQRKKAIIDTNL